MSLLYPVLSTSQKILFKSLSVLLFISAAIAAPEVLKRDDSTIAVVNTSQLGQLSVLFATLGLTGTPTYATVVPTCLGGYNPPNPSLYAAIMTGVPGSVLGELANPTARSSIASEFKAGNTPQWYINLPSEVKSYISSLQTATATGCSATTTATDEVEATGVAGVFVAATSSSALAAHNTAAVAAGLGGLLGFVGVMLAL